MSERHVFLIGFMATGKTTVGRRLADALGRPLRDLDQIVADAADDTISNIFAREEEAGFRAREADALAGVIGDAPAVVATGGGAPCSGDNLDRMRAAGVVVALTAPLPEVRRRAAGDDSRPLLRRPAAEVEALYESRTPVYRRAHASVRTEGRTPAEVARDVADVVRAADAIPTTALADSSVVALAHSGAGASYPVIVADGALDRVGQVCRQVAAGAARVGLVTDDNVAPLYADRTRRALEAAGFAVTDVVVPAGERAKCFAQLERVTAALIAGGLDRGSAVVALGGGVVGDLAGFAAACLFRGVACVQVPTSALAMVDAAIGGKTGIDTPAGKNLVGAFWQPRAVIADPAVLATLPARELRAAFGELVKYGLLDGEPLLDAVAALAPLAAEAAETARPGPLADPGRRAALTRVIARCAAYKSWVVARDERERSGERALLNLGHTVGHAIEAAADYTVLHGEAVALGLLAACRVSAHLGRCGPALEARVADILARAGLDVALDPWLRPDVLSRIGVDKKRAGSQVKFIVPEAVGRCVVEPLEITAVQRIFTGAPRTAPTA